MYEATIRGVDLSLRMTSTLAFASRSSAMQLWARGLEISSLLQLKIVASNAVSRLSASGSVSGDDGGYDDGETPVSASEAKEELQEL